MKKIILILTLFAGWVCAYGDPLEIRLHPFSQNGKWGYKDQFDNIVIAPSYDACRDFYGGMAAVMLDGKWGVIDISGTRILDFSYDSIGNFSEGYVHAVRNSVSYYVDQYGNEQKLISGYTYGSFSSGLAPVLDQKTGKWGYINTKGRIVIDPVYDAASRFSNEVARVLFKGKEHYIRPSGFRTKKGAEKFNNAPVLADIVYMNAAKENADKEIALANVPKTAVADPIPVSAPVQVPVEVVQSQPGTGHVSELLDGIHMVAEPDPDKFALIIGNEDYNTFKQEAVYEQNVDYAVADAETFREYAVNYMGVPESNVILMRNAQKYLMNRNLNKLVDQAMTDPGNRELYVFYAGHGVHDEATRDTYLLPVDISSNTPKDGIRLDDVYAKLASSQAKRVMVFMDACYSGKGRGIIIVPNEPIIKGNMVVFTATSATQKSMPYQDKKHGMFTYFLLKTIRDNSGAITVSDLYNSVKIDVESSSTWINDSKQSPELLHGQDIEAGWEQWTLD